MCGASQKGDRVIPFFTHFLVTILGSKKRCNEIVVKKLSLPVAQLGGGGVRNGSILIGRGYIVVYVSIPNLEFLQELMLLSHNVRTCI